jgi:hypothetical protein
MLLGNAIVQRPELRRPIDRMQRELDQNPPQPRRALFRQLPQASLAAGGMNGGHQPGVRTQVATVREAVHVPDLTEDQQGGVGANPGHRAEQLRLRIGSRLRRDRLGDLSDVFSQGIELPQLAIEGEAVARTHGDGGQIPTTLDATGRFGWRLQSALANNRRNLILHLRPQPHE